MKSAQVTQIPVAALWVAVFLFALVTRFYDLANKPIHFDESINGWFVMQMPKLGFYKYDPNNYHGPLYFYLVQFMETLRGRSLETLRTVPAIFSCLSVMIFAGRFLQSASIQRWMAVFVVTSPAFLFFGRSGIHEMPFVFFQITFALGVLRWQEAGDRKALALGLIGLWGMVTLKETFAVTLFCWGLALASFGPAQLRILLGRERVRQAWSAGLGVLSLVLFALFVIVFTGFFKNGAGLVDFVKAFFPWLKTGVHGQGHEKSFVYWFQVLWEAEPLALLGVFFAMGGVFSSHRSLRLMSVFSLGQLLIYSLIPYKTVWCLLSLVWGFYFVLAMVLVRLSELPVFSRMLALATGSVLLGVSLQSGYRSNFRHPIDFEHPFVYVNSTDDLKILQSLLEHTAQNNPKLLQEPVQIGMQEQWPWPWVLRDFRNLHYDLCARRVVEKAAVYFCDPDEVPAVDSLLREPYWKISLPLRQDRESSMIYLKKSLFPEIPFKIDVSEIGLEAEVK